MREKEIKSSPCHYWLLKSEPEEWSWQDQVRAGTAVWDGVRNYQARNNLMAMKLGDQAFFYHSGSERSIVGIVEVVKAAYPDPADSQQKFFNINVKAVKGLPCPVRLERLKAEPNLASLPLIRQPRLSVMPLEEEVWHFICILGGL